MANRMKEDEKNERIIRGLLKLPANKRCINCNNLGPQYVCTNFWTFICTNCSGAHREFTHRVKSVSMAKFTSQEVATLQGGGNERAREIYFKEWDPQRHSFPDSSNVDRLRDFIKHVYIDRRFTGEKNVDPSQRMKGVREENTESRTAESYRGGSRSPPYEDQYKEHLSSVSRNDDQNSRYNYGQRSPEYDQGDYRRSPAQFGVVDNRRQDDRPGNGNQNRRFEEHRIPEAMKPEVRSPEYRKDIQGSNPPVVHPVRDILGGDVPTRQLGDPPKLNGIRPPDNSALTKRTSSSSSIASSDGNSVQSKILNTGSLIDFSSDPEPPVAAVPQQSVPQQTTSVSANGGDWASFDVASQQKVPHVTSNANPLESALAEMSAPTSTLAGNISITPTSGIDSSPKANGGWQVPMIQQQQPLLFPAVDNLSSNQSSNLPVSGAPNNLAWKSSPGPYAQGSFTAPAIAPAGHFSHIATKPPQQKTAAVSSQQYSVENKPSRRNELPADLFTSLYPSVPMYGPGWQRGPYPGMAHGMNYPTGVVIPAFSQYPKSVNPFDLTSEPAQVFPSMTSLQGALPNMTAPAALQRNPSFGVTSPRWVTLQQSSYPSTVPPSLHMQQQITVNMPQQLPHNVIPTGHQGIGGPASGGAAVGISVLDQQSSVRFSLSNTPNSFGPVGGNPFE